MTTLNEYIVPEKVSAIIVELNFIGETKPGYKPCFSTRKFVEAYHSGGMWSWIYSIYGSGVRMLWHESGADLKIQLRRIIHDAFEHYNTCHLRHRPSLLKAMERARVGISSLIETYSKNYSVVLDLKLIYDEISEFLKDHGFCVPKKDELEEL